VSLRQVFLIKRKLDYDDKHNVEEYVDLEVHQFGDLKKGVESDQRTVEFDLMEIKQNFDNVVSLIRS